MGRGVGPAHHSTRKPRTQRHYTRHGCGQHIDTAGPPPSHLMKTDGVRVRERTGCARRAQQVERRERHSLATSSPPPAG